MRTEPLNTGRVFALFARVQLFASDDDMSTAWLVEFGFGTGIGAKQWVADGKEIFPLRYSAVASLLE